MLEFLFPVVRGLIALALVLLIGTVVAAPIARKEGPAEGTASHAVIAGWFDRLPGLLAWFLLTCAIVRGMLQLLAFLDPGEPITAELAQAVLLEGSWGGAWVIQTSAAFLLLTSSWLLRHRPSIRTSVILALVLAATTAQSFLGHGADDIWTGALGRVVHTAHVLGSGIWLGTLAVLALTTMPHLRGAEALPQLSGVLRRFSTMARLGVALVVLSGTTALWTYSGGDLLALPTSTWGRLLLIKLVLVLGALAIGWWNWKRGTPALIEGAADSEARMRRAIRAELWLGLGVLGLTAWLVGSPLPSHLG